MRISDATRQRAVSELTRHCGEGRLTLDELEERIDEVYAAADDAGLRHAFRELPPFRVEPARTDEHAARTVRPARARTAGRCGSRMVGVPPCVVVPLVVLALVTWKVLLVVVFVMVVLPVRATRAFAASRA